MNYPELLAIRLTSGSIAYYDEIADREMISRSNLVRKALILYSKHHEQVIRPQIESVLNDYASDHLILKS